MKACSKCGGSFPLTEFNNSKKSEDGKGSKCKDCRQDYYNENKERINATRRARRKRVKNYWRQTDPEKLRRNTMRYYYRLREKLFNHLSDGTPKCAVCGFSGDLRLLQVDHINDDGKEERKKKSTEKIYRDILKMTPEEAREKYQVLCMVHNWLKKFGDKGEQYALIHKSF